MPALVVAPVSESVEVQHMLNDSLQKATRVSLQCEFPAIIPRFSFITKRPSSYLQSMVAVGKQCR